MLLPIHSFLIFIALPTGAFIGVLAYMLWRQFNRKDRQALELQQQLKSRSAELAALSSHLQEISEREKQMLARELHDALGGLLVATKMDVAWLRSRLPTEDPDLQLRWKRIQQSLDQGVDLKRRIVEQLRPTLLDNMGLYSAINWQFQESCSRAGLRCTAQLPEEEPKLKSEAAIALFRIAQESFTNILKHSGASEAHLRVNVQDDTLFMSIRDNGCGFPAGRTGSLTTGSGQGLPGMRHRALALGGTLEAMRVEEGGAEIRLQVQLNGLLRTENPEL